MTHHIRISTLILTLSLGLSACATQEQPVPPADSLKVVDHTGDVKARDSNIIKGETAMTANFPDERLTVKSKTPFTEVAHTPEGTPESEIEVIKIKESDTPYAHRETIVSRKVSQLSKDVTKIKKFVTSYQDEIKALQENSEEVAGEYYGYVASIQSRLQGGSTPGNPILVESLQESQKRLDELAQDVGELNKLANDISSNASVASFLLESVRATYNLSGAVEEDHDQLTDLEDDLNSLIVKIDRQLNELSDDVNRRASYLATERRNIQTLALAVSNGEPYGQSLARKAFGPVSTLSGVTNTVSSQPLDAPNTPERAARFSGTRPLVVIRFDRPKVDYEQALYMAANQALDKFPDAFFEIVAVTPARGNPAQRALASSDARKNAEEVFRNLVQMGVPSQRLKLSAAQSPEAGTPEIHLFVR